MGDQAAEMLLGEMAVAGVVVGIFAGVVGAEVVGELFAVGVVGVGVVGGLLFVGGGLAAGVEGAVIGVVVVVAGVGMVFLPWCSS